MMSQLTASLMSAVPMPLVLISSDGRVQAMNQTAIDLMGASGVGRNHIAIVRQPAILDCIDAALKGQRPGRARYIDTRPTKQAVYRVVAAPVRGETGSGVLVTFEDITDVERADQMRRDFVANVSHELKTPLTALLAYIETLRGPAREDAAARERFLATMAREAARMERLVADLLSLSRVESSERQRPADPVDLREVVRAVLSTLQPMAQAARVTLETEIPAQADLRLLGDEDQLVQVFTNLTENAVKYGGAGGRVTIRIQRRDRDLAFRGPALQVDVRDYGDGFDPIHIPRITERFYRVDAHRSREKGGTGLGLAIAKHIVTRHRGRLRIDSEPGQGAEFSVLLPAL